MRMPITRGGGASLGPADYGVNYTGNPVRFRTLRNLSRAQCADLRVGALPIRNEDELGVMFA